MARKVFMSVMGTSLYEECNYYSQTAENNIRTRFVQEATIRLFCGQWTANDEIIIFTTRQSYSDNYKADISQRYDRRTNATIEYIGLAKILSNLDLPVPIKNVPIKDGNTEGEIWEIFETIYNELKVDDEIYFDITHSFRYLPMLLMILLSYSEFLKSTSVKAITYGNFEVSRANNGFAPIMDLMPLVLLKDWSIAANNFEQFGEVNLISSLCQQSLKPILREAQGSNKAASALNSFSKDLPGFIATLKTCRGPEIISGEKAIALERKIADAVETSLAPFNPIFSRIKTQINRFASNNNIKNGFVAVDWCIKNGLIQQGLTMLQETIISVVCESAGLDIDKEKYRTIVSSAFTILEKAIPEPEWKGECAESENLELTRNLCKSRLLQSLLKDYVNLSSSRNDINHFGMRSNPSKPERLEKNLKEIFCSVLSKTANL